MSDTLFNNEQLTAAEWAEVLRQRDDASLRQWLLDFCGGGDRQFRRIVREWSYDDLIDEMSKLIARHYSH